MLELRQRFIDLAVRPLAGKEAAEDLARGELMERLNHAVAGKDDDSLAVAVQKLEQVPPVAARRWSAMVAAVLAVLLIALCILGFTTWQEVRRIDAGYGLLPGDPHQPAERALSQGRSAEERLFLFAGSRYLGLEDKWPWLEACAAQLPADPGWLEEYAAHRRPLPAEYFVHARQIDPGNGMWDLMEARTAANRSSFSDRPRRGSGVLPGSIVTDDAYRQAVSLIEKAVAQPRIESWIPARNVRRLELLGPPRDLAELVDQRLLLTSLEKFRLADYRLDDIWGMRAKELAASGDMEALRAWIATWEALMRRGPESISDGVQFNSRRLEELRKIAAGAGLADEDARLQRWRSAAFKPLAGTHSSTVQEVYARVAAIDRGNWIYYAPFLAETVDLEPGRRAERAMADRILAMMAAVLFGILACFAAFEGWRRSTPVRGLAVGVWPLLRPADFLWLGGLGLVLPAAWYGVIDGFSPLGCRDYSIVAWGMKPTGLRAAGGSCSPPA